MASSRRLSSLWNVILAIAIAVFVACSIYLVAEHFRYDIASGGYEDIALHAIDLPDDQEISLTDLTVDWDYLRSINSDVVAWIYYPGTRINYPVVQGATNATYIHTDFTYQEGFTAIGGAIFMDSGNNSDFTDDDTFIYGHHMNDGSMFACLSTQLSYQDEFNAYREFFVLTPTMNYRCNSFAIDRVPGTEPVVMRNFENDAKRIEYINNKCERSIVRPVEGFPAAADIEQMFALATCDYSDNDTRAILYASIAETAVPSKDISGAIRSEELTDAQNSIAQ